jgi:hypothetical protein
MENESITLLGLVEKWANEMGYYAKVYGLGLDKWAYIVLAKTRPIDPRGGYLSLWEDGYISSSHIEDVSSISSAQPDFFQKLDILINKTSTAANRLKS